MANKCDHGISSPGKTCMQDSKAKDSRSLAMKEPDQEKNWEHFQKPRIGKERNIPKSSDVNEKNSKANWDWLVI